MLPKEQSIHGDDNNGGQKAKDKGQTMAKMKVEYLGEKKWENSQKKFGTHSDHIGTMGELSHQYTKNGRRSIHHAATGGTFDGNNGGAHLHFRHLSI